MKDTIEVTIKFYSDLHTNLNLKDYDPFKGITLNLKKGSRLRGALKKTGLKKVPQFNIFRDGERISKWTKLNDKDEISCIKPSGGG